jgi:hypothetical protein
MRAASRIVAGCLLLAAVQVLSLAARSSATTIEGIAGWESGGSDQGYGFMTAGLLAREKSGGALPLRVTGSYLYYEYERTAGRVTVQAPGVSGLAGVRRSGHSGSISLLLGGEVRRERREPDPGGGAITAAWRGGVVAQAEGALSLGRFQPQGLLVYSGASRYVYGRGLLRWQCSNRAWTGPTTWFLGLEGVGQGNADVSAVQAGAAVDCAFVRQHLNVGLRGGAKRTSSGGTDRDGGYFGIGLYRAF